jgi:hypothetical protein
VLGIEPSKSNWVRVATIINEGLPDLITMPSAPERELMKASVGEMKLLADGAQIAGEEIRLEKDLVTYA